jgi:hypothetical protein
LAACLYLLDLLVGVSLAALLREWNKNYLLDLLDLLAGVPAMNLDLTCLKNVRQRSKKLLQMLIIRDSHFPASYGHSIGSADSGDAGWAMAST